MRMALRFVGISVMALALGAAPLAAQGGVTVSLSGGAVLPTSSGFDDAFKLGWNGQLGIGFTPANLPVGFEATGNFMRNSAEAPEGVDVDLSNQIISGTGNIVYTFTTAAASRFHPYLLAGGGVYNLKNKGDDAVDTEGVTKAGIDAGAGFDFMMANIGVFLEGRFHNVFVEGENANFVTGNLGVRFSFGGETGGTTTDGM
jgi:hypothetical protein